MQPGPPADADDASAAGGTAVVMARLQEAADVWNDQGKKGDSYASTYKVLFAMLCFCYTFYTFCAPPEDQPASTAF